MLTRTFFSLMFLAACLPVVHGQQIKAHQEQTEFCPDSDRLRRPVNLPPKVLDSLLRTEEVQHSMKGVSDVDRKKPGRFFRAAEVHIGPAKADVALVVIGIRPVSGADQEWFWIVQSPYQNPKIVLFAGGNCLTIEKNRTNGYRDIGTSGSTASKFVFTIYRFNRDKYVLREEKWEEAR